MKKIAWTTTGLIGLFLMAAGVTQIVGAQSYQCSNTRTQQGIWSQPSGCSLESMQCSETRSADTCIPATGVQCYPSGTVPVFRTSDCVKNASGDWVCPASDWTNGNQNQPAKESSQCPM